MYNNGSAATTGNGNSGNNNNPAGLLPPEQLLQLKGILAVAYQQQQQQQNYQQQQQQQQYQHQSLRPFGGNGLPFEMNGGQSSGGGSSAASSPPDILPAPVPSHFPYHQHPFHNAATGDGGRFPNAGHQQLQVLQGFAGSPMIPPASDLSPMLAAAAANLAVGSPCSGAVLAAASPLIPVAATSTSNTSSAQNSPEQQQRRMFVPPSSIASVGSPMTPAGSPLAAIMLAAGLLGGSPLKPPQSPFTAPSPRSQQPQQQQQKQYQQLDSGNIGGAMTKFGTVQTDPIDNSSPMVNFASVLQQFHEYASSAAKALGSPQSPPLKRRMSAKSLAPTLQQNQQLQQEKSPRSADEDTSNRCPTTEHRLVEMDSTEADGGATILRKIRRRRPKGLGGGKGSPASVNNKHRRSSVETVAGGIDGPQSMASVVSQESVDSDRTIPNTKEPMLYNNNNNNCSPPPILPPMRAINNVQQHEENNADEKAGICKVCGDDANGYNFNVYSCESCKAFFRRNALRQKGFKCTSSYDNCPINKESRRFCQKCRLEKCFKVGMRKDWILTEDQLRKRKNARIRTQNRSSSEIDVEDNESHGVAGGPTKNGEKVKRRGSGGSTGVAAASLDLYSPPPVVIQQPHPKLLNTPNTNCQVVTKSPVGTLALVADQIKLSPDSVSHQVNKTNSNSSGNSSPTNGGALPQQYHQLPQVCPPLNSPQKLSPNFNGASVVNGFDQHQLYRMHIPNGPQQSNASNGPASMMSNPMQHGGYHNLDAYRGFQQRMYTTIESAIEEYNKPLLNIKRRFSEEALRQMYRLVDEELSPQVDRSNIERTVFSLEIEDEDACQQNGSIERRSMSNDAEDGKVTLTSAETDDIDKLMKAFTQMDEKMDAQKMQKYALVLKQPEATMIFNMLDEVIRRLVFTFLRVEAFGKLSKTGQFALCKNTIIPLLSLRAATLSQPNGFQSEVLGGTQFSLDFFDKLNDPLQKDRFKGFINVIDEKLKKDKTAMCTISTIILFKGYESADLEFMDRDSAAKTYVYYKRLLERYLGSKHGVSEAQRLMNNLDIMLDSLSRVSEAAKTVFKGVVNPEGTEKLVSEIFPIT